MKPPETHFAKSSDGLHVAYQVTGDGPLDIVFPPAWGCIDVVWDEPSFAHVLERLAGMGRLICLDFRGLGSSDAIALGALPTPEEWMEDFRVVLDSIGSERAVLVTWGLFARMGMMFAATYPERTTALVLIEASPRTLQDADYPFGATPAGAEAMIAAVQQTWGTGHATLFQAPSRRGDEAFERWAARAERLTLSQAAIDAAWRWAFNVDVRPILPAIRVPTLLVHRARGGMAPFDHSPFLAEQIPGARLIEFSGVDSFPFTNNIDGVLDHIEEFITGSRPVRDRDRALATVLFTDIVGSTGHAARLGDKRWTELLDGHDVLVTRELERHRGRKVNPTGDGVLATFDGPARAIRCAQAIGLSVRALGIEVRAGLHTGEVELRGEDIGGIAVHIGQRVSALAGPGEVLVSRTVTDLVVGSGLEFENRGEHELKGVPGKWMIYAVIA